jgi:hypothetical protein
MASLKRMRKRAHVREREDAERLALAAMSFERAMTGALAKKAAETETQKDVEQEEAVNGERS